MWKILASIVVLAVPGCAAPKPAAYINDVSVKSDLDAGYRVAAVDGKPEKRAESHIDTVVPYVEISPGTHTLTLQSADSTQKALTISASVEDGKRYRLAKHDGTIVLVEDVRQAGPDSESPE